MAERQPDTATEEAASWIRFLRGYGPIPENDNMYDETIQRLARKSEVDPIAFEHPRWPEVLSAVKNDAVSVILTGTAGDGKTHLCREVWLHLGNPKEDWNLNSPHLERECLLNGGNKRLHVIRDLSAWAPQQGASWGKKKAQLLDRFCASLLGQSGSEVFLIAANDGQLIETLKRLRAAQGIDTDRADKVFHHLEFLLREDRTDQDGARVKMFNLSRDDPRKLLDRALKSLLAHKGWEACYKAAGPDDQFFGAECPIRRNYELLRKESGLASERLRSLLSLCFYNDFHVPIRQILLLLSNAILGHPGVTDRLMRPDDVPKILKKHTRFQASLYENIFGMNLDKPRREGILIFRYLEHFRIGKETSNRIDEQLVYGSETEHELQLLKADTFYGAGEHYWESRKSYTEAGEEEERAFKEFAPKLVQMRRALFFQLQDGHEALWQLTAFRYAGQYLNHVVGKLQSRKKVHTTIVKRLVLGLNRIFTGMLAKENQSLFLAEGLVSSQARVSTLLKAQLSLNSPIKGEKIEVVMDSRGLLPVLRVHVGFTAIRRTSSESFDFPLRLTQFEFLNRVAAGVLPDSFSKEFCEEALVFKGRLLEYLEGSQGADLRFEILSVTDTGSLDAKLLEVYDA